MLMNAGKAKLKTCYLLTLIFTARVYARAVLGVVIMSVRLSHAWIVTNLNGALQIFWHHTKGQSLCYSDTNSGWWPMLPCPWKLRSKWPTPFEKRRLRQISAYNVSTVRYRKRFNYEYKKSTTGFPTTHRRNAYVAPKCPKGWLKERFFTARAYARAVLGVVTLSVCPFVCLSHAWIVTKLNDALETLVWILKRVIVGLPFTRAFLKSPSSRGLSAITELLVLIEKDAIF